MNKHIAGLLTLLAACVPVVVPAATFNVLCDDSREIAAKACTVHLSGRIENGDADRLRSVLLRRLPDGWHYGSLLLESPGGNVNAALQVATLVRQSLLNTTTVRLSKGPSSSHLRRKCVSACFLIWVAGADRYTFTFTIRNETWGIGLHRPYLDAAAYEGQPEKVAAMQQQVMQVTAEYLKREQIPQTLIEKMLQRASTQVYWLTEGEDNDLSGRAPWFEEMMIARCGYDPTYDSETQRWAMSVMHEDHNRQFASGKKRLAPTNLGPRYEKYLEWRRKYNACEYAARAAAQEAIRR